MQFATMAMQGKPVKLQGLEKKDGYYDVKLYTISDENINAMFGSVVEEVQQSAETTPQLRNATAEIIPFHKPVKGELVCALFSEDSTWYRAEVLNISGEDYEHRFVDYGNCETTKCSNIRKIDETLTVIPKFGVCCNLKGVDLKSLPEEMILECLTLLTSDTVQVQAVQKNEQSYDIVVYTSNGENINQKFMLMPSNQEPVPEMYMASELPMKHYH
ncbi:TDRD1_4_6_7 [Mytilus edulis]|uniref:TDRD1_4_6_7 n=1 Tax=Mytilus edulis TaxID=6550 RepID=A0A8S3VPW9_MYTED|nr:TDRD1_4_6_7 [Mytilus edulis]